MALAWVCLNLIGTEIVILSPTPSCSRMLKRQPIVLLIPGVCLFYVELNRVSKVQKTDDQYCKGAFWAPTRRCMGMQRAFLYVVIKCRWETSSISDSLSMKCEISKLAMDEIIEWKTFWFYNHAFLNTQRRVNPFKVAWCCSEFSETFSAVCSKALNSLQIWSGWVWQKALAKADRVGFLGVLAWA